MLTCFMPWRPLLRAAVAIKPMLSVIMPNAVILNVMAPFTVLAVACNEAIMSNATMPNVVMLHVMAPPTVVSVAMKPLYQMSLCQMSSC